MQTQPATLFPQSILNRTLLLTLYLSPLLALIWFVWQLGVNIPYRDDWALLSLFEKIYDGNVQFADFYVQHSEHRILFPKLLFSWLAFSTGWDLRYQLGLNIFFGAIACLALFGLSLRTARRLASPQPLLFHLVNFTTVCLVFSWLQSQNWLWGFQVAWFLINACITFAIFILCRDEVVPWQRLLLAAIVCTLASFSSAHGLFTWVALVPCIVALPLRWPVKLRYLLLWGGSFVLCLAVYLRGYFKPALQEPDGNRTIVSFLEYFFTQIGSSLFGHNIGIISVQIMGVLICCMVFSMMFYSLTRLFSKSFMTVSPWLSLGLHATVFALATSYGRSAYGAAQAREGRYVTATTLLAIALLQFLPVFVAFAKSTAQKRRLSRTAIGLTALFLVVNLSGYASAFQDAKVGERGLVLRQQQTLCLALSRYIKEAAFSQCYVDNDVTKADAITLDRIGFRTAVDDIAFVKSSASIVETDRVDVQREESQITISGRIALPSDRSNLELPRAVLLALPTKREFLAVADLGVDRLDDAAGDSEVLWTVKLTDEDSLLLVQEAQQLDVYLYYPARSQFVLTDKVLVST